MYGAHVCGGFDDELTPTGTNYDYGSLSEDYHNDFLNKDAYLPIFCGWWEVDSMTGVFRDFLVATGGDIHIGSLIDCRNRIIILGTIAREK